MNRLNLTVHNQNGGESALDFPVRRLLLAGFTGRNQKIAMKHVEELRAHGVEAPKKIPAFYAVPSPWVVTDSEIEVLGSQTSGEVEPVLLFSKGIAYLGVGSDHTDRELEKTSIAKSKVMCAKILARDLWKLKSVQRRWDRLLLRSWIGAGRRKKLYQEAYLKTFLPPDKLIKLARAHVRDRKLEGMAFFLGTVPIIGSGFGFASGFTGELLDESTNRRLSFSYRIRPMGWLK